MPNFNKSSAPLLKRAIDSGITSPTELSNIMGNASVETRNFTTMHEDLNYKSVAAIENASRSANKRFTEDQIKDAVDSGKPSEVAKILYEDRKDLGNTEPGDGYRYHGRGYFQYTGRNNYETFGKKFDVDLAGNPDLAADPETSAKLAIAYWKDRVPENERSDARAAGQRINGGHNGADARVRLSEDWSKRITPELVEDIRSGKITLEKLEEEKTVESQNWVKSIKLGAHGEAVGTLQTDLAALGYTDSRGRPLHADKDFGRDTDTALKTFQRDHGLKQDGIAGPATLKAIHEQCQQQAIDSPTSQVSNHTPLFADSDPRNKSHANHALYNELHQRIPEASENRLLQFTAACHSNNITANTLSTIHLNEAAMNIGFAGSGPLSSPVFVDLNTKSPQPEQSIQQIQQYNQQQVQMTTQTQAQNAQLNAPTQ
ncbi:MULTISPECIES: peptidoglycan-binding protein [Xanthomonas]|uniref:Peptidoglycan-binding protein n=1 Tax=Xanthomonas cucurbitae TaxID=56453 RepID=A0ABY7YH01_9XANT|nr:peptidoglycan-binding protein [Xanthomonas cucurbitae]QHG86997.1 hypothetical protein EBN15_08305 [Xanthomonas cucurbitae]WDM69320.1 peptidoglycan-binding protein [Xanthomonas cucurbitae]WDM73193.1 peptidoglycan-binding protein [Xanthomonas cucurbitae]WDM76916.1 peptidoglycan-binding protein [Xanthomonas cucurbitae]